MDFKKAIEESLDKLRALASQRDEIEWEMGKLQLAVRGLCNVVTDKAEREAYKQVLDRYRVHTGLTDLISLCFRMFDKSFTPAELRDFIVNYGSEASQQQNLLQSVHTIVKRMVESGEVKAVENEDGEKAYRKATIGERLLNLVPQPEIANRVGNRMESRFKMMPISVLMGGEPGVKAGLERLKKKD